MVERQIKPVGDKCIQISFSQHISPETNQQIRRFHEYLKQADIHGMIETVPAYTSLAVFYDPSLITYGEMVVKLEETEHCLDEVKLPSSLIYEIPVQYGGEYGPDLSFVARHNQLTEAEVIEIHAGNDYLIYMMGFVPGFPYLGGMSEQIAAPRLENPRAKVEAGSVGIAEKQTGIYPLESPGGWQIIGKTPLKLYDPNSVEPAVFSTGDYLRFTPVSKDEYERISEEVNNGTYKIVTHEVREELMRDFN